LILVKLIINTNYKIVDSVTEFDGAICQFYGAFHDFSGPSTTSYMAGTMGTSRWWILATSTVDSALAVGPEHLDAADAMGISSGRVTDTVGTSSSWRATIAMGVMGAVPTTSALASSSMSPI
jgi:hypothetical protein